MNDQFIEWQQLWDLYDKLSETRIVSLGLSQVPKLKRVHLEHTSFSRMRVDLATQVQLHVEWYTVNQDP